MSASSNAETITLTSDNTLILDETITHQSVARVIESAKVLDSKLESKYPIYLFLYTPGGSIQAGVELIEYLQGLNRPVHTVTLFAASMGFQMIQHMNKRYVVKYGVLMSHKARGQFSGQFGGKISEIDTRYGLWLRRVQLMDEQTVKRTKGKQTLKTYTSAYNPELWLNGVEAVDKGYADKVVNVKCDDSLSGTRFIIEKQGFFRGKVILSECPMQTGVIEVIEQIYTNRGLMSIDDFIEKNGSFGKCENPMSLCAKDETLTIEKIQEKANALKTKYSKDPKENVQYSY